MPFSPKRKHSRRPIIPATPKPRPKSGRFLVRSGYLLIGAGIFFYILLMTVAFFDRENNSYSLGVIALRTLLCNLPLFVFGAVLFLLGRRRQAIPGSAFGDTRAQFEHGLRLFNEGKPREAIPFLEVVTRADPTFAPAQFTLGAAYIRVAGEYGDDEQSTRLWANKSADAFQKAIELSQRHGGLNDRQVSIAQNAVRTFARAESNFQARKETPSLPEEQRKRIYAEYKETVDSELLQGINLQDMTAASRRGDLAGMAQQLDKKAADARETTIARVTQKHNLSREQLLAIVQEGDQNAWPFKAGAS